jgi:hypothetical protein
MINLLQVQQLTDDRFSTILPCWYPRPSCPIAPSWDSSWNCSCLEESFDSLWGKLSWRCRNGAPGERWRPSDKYYLNKCLGSKPKQLSGSTMTKWIHNTSKVLIRPCGCSAKYHKQWTWPTVTEVWDLWRTKEHSQTGGEDCGVNTLVGRSQIIRWLYKTLGQAFKCVRIIWEKDITKLCCTFEGKNMNSVWILKSSNCFFSPIKHFQKQKLKDCRRSYFMFKDAKFNSF